MQDKKLYSDVEINEKLLNSLGYLLRFDHYLLENDINERSISHKLAEYLSFEFPNYNIDCEFNKVFKDPKIIGIFKNLIQDVSSTKEFMRDEINQLAQREVETGEVLYDLKTKKLIEARNISIKRIYPDIIIHHRGSSENLLVIELKKTTNKSESQRKWDEEKLKYVTTKPPFNYKFGAMIEIPCGSDLRKFKNFQASKIASFNILNIK